jgi:hypothetical protein
MMNDEWTNDEHQMTNDARFNFAHISSMFNKGWTTRLKSQNSRVDIAHIKQHEHWDHKLSNKVNIEQIVNHWTPTFEIE